MQGNRKREVWGTFLRGPPATSSSSNKEPGSTSPQWFSPYSVFWPCARASLALIRPSASGDWTVMRQVPRKNRYLGSNFYSGLVYTTWKVSTDWKILNLYPREFPEFPSIVFGRIREKEQVGKNIITAVNELFSPGVTWGRSRTRKKLIKGKVPPNNKSLDDQLKSLVNGPHKK